MNLPLAPDVTQILHDWSAGDESAAERLMPVVYEKLRQRAAHYLGKERPDHTLQATALVHEAYLKLIDQTRTTWSNWMKRSKLSPLITRAKAKWWS